MESKADWFKVGSGYLLGSAAFAFCLYAAWNVGSHQLLQVLLCIFGGVFGWVVGILITPLNEGEKKQFSDYAKAVSTLISGYLLAKLESFAQLALTGMATSDGESLFLRFLLFFTCFLIGTLCTFISRRYVRGTEDERRAKREKALAEVQESLTKLSSLN